MTTPNAVVDKQLQMLDVHIVDVLSHLEALLRQSHTIQRKLLTLRSEAPPPASHSVGVTIPDLQVHAGEMRQECNMLSEIIDDLSSGLTNLRAAHG
jgi:hypothetical protein